MSSNSTPTRFRDVTPSNSVPINATLGLFVGTGGIVKAAGADGVVATFAAGTGQYLVGHFTYVMATGTTASGIVALSQA